MWELIEILPDCIFFMASILGGMGTGSNTGKISFKKILSAGDLEITESDTSLTFNIVSGSGQSIGIPQSQMVFGNTVSGITSSVRFITKAGQNSGGATSYTSAYGNSLYGFGSIINSLNGAGDTTVGDKSLNVSSFNNCPCKSLILGGGNTICTTSYSIIIGGFTNSIYGLGNNSAIVGGYYNKIGAGSKFSTIMSSKNSKILASSVRSSIISSYDSSIYSFAREHHSIISSNNGSINLYDGVGCDKFNLILSSENSRIQNSGTVTQNCNRSNQILASSTSCIKSCSPKNSYEGFLKFNTIAASMQSSIISASQSGGFSSSYNSIFSTENSCISGGSFNTVLGGCCNKILNSPGLTTCGLNTVLNSECSNIFNFQNSTIVGSYKIQKTTSNQRIKNVTLINENQNCVSDNTYYSIGIGSMCSGIKGSRSSILGGYFNCILSSCSSIIGGCKNTIKVSSGVYETCEINTSGRLIVSSITTTASFFSLATNNSIFYSLSSGIGGECNKGAISVINPYTSYEEGGFRTTADHSVLIGGCCNSSFSNKYSSVIASSFKSKIFNSKNNIIIGGLQNTISSKGQFYHVDDSDLCNRSNRSFIIGGELNRLRNGELTQNFITDGIMCLENSGVIGGRCNQLFSSYTCNSLIIGGSGLTSSKSNTLIIQSLLISGTLSTSPSSGVICCGISGTFNNIKLFTFVNGIVTNVV